MGENNIAYKIWRQAYVNSEGTLRPAKPIIESERGFMDAINELQKSWPRSFNRKEKGTMDITWCGLQLYVDEDDANKEPFNINRYGTRR